MLASRRRLGRALLAVAGYAGPTCRRARPASSPSTARSPCRRRRWPARPPRCCCPSRPRALDPLLSDTGADAPAPTRGRPAAALDRRHPATRRSGRAVGVRVRDGVTGDAAARPRRRHAPGPRLDRQAADRPRRGRRLDPATGCPPGRPGRGPADIVLVAGGDTLLAPGAGTPRGGRAGPGSPTSPPRSPPRCAARAGPRCAFASTSRYAAGPRYPSTWNPARRAAGFTQAVAMLGLATQRRRALHPSPLRARARGRRRRSERAQPRGVTATLRPRTVDRGTAAPRCSAASSRRTCGRRARPRPRPTATTP